MDNLKFDKNSSDIIKFDFEDRRNVEEHSTPNIEILYVLEGSVTVTVAKNSYQMEKDDILAVNPNKPHSLHAKEPVFIGVICINYREFQKYINTNHYYLCCNSVINKNRGYQELRRLMDKIFHLYYERNEKKLYLNSLYFAFLHTFVSNFVYQNESLLNLDPKSAAELRMNDIINYINSNYQYSFSLADLAESLNLSPAYLSKFIKKTLGKNFLEYLSHVRLSNAVDDMRRTKKPLSHISLDNGFPNTAAFTSAFRKEYGKNPSVWLQEYQSQKAHEASMPQEIEKKKHIQTYLEKNPEASEKPENTKPSEILECSALSGTPFKHNWNRLINIGSVTSLLRSDLQEQILLLRRDLKIEYVRFWDLLTESMLIDMKESHGKYNFTRIDKIFDFLTDNGIHPFIELGFKPDNRTRTLDNQRSTERPIPYKSPADLQKILYAFLSHCVNRYGMSEIEQWYFEQWGDPRITSIENYGKYFEIFESSYYTVKSVSPKIHIGGAGFGRLYSTLEFKEIISLWKQRPCHPDFISLYGYPYLARSNNTVLNNDRIQDPNFVNNQVMMMKEVMQKVSLLTPELLVTEWSSSISNWNVLNDSTYKGAFMLKTIIDNVGCADMMGYWLASDILTEHFDTTPLLQGGNGLLSSDGIKKPAYYAIDFANQLGNTLLAKNNHAIVTQTESRNYSIACHNYIQPNFRYYLKSEDAIDVHKQFLLFDEAEDLHLRFRITNVLNGKYLIKFHSLNAEHGSVQDEWAAMNYSRNLISKDISYLKNISTPRITIIEQTVENHILEIQTTLKPHEIQYIHLRHLLE